MKISSVSVVLFHSALSAAFAMAAAPNDIALNKPVTVVSGSASISNPSTPLSVITDGTFTPESTGYGSSTAQTEAIEWAGAGSGTPTGDTTPTGALFQINLGATYNINGAIVQGDDNDSYLLQYHNIATNTWQTLWNVPSVSVGFGLTTRPNADQTTYQSVGPVATDAVRFSATQGDGFYAISELELTGSAVPEPTSLLSLAGAGVLLLRRPRRSAM